MEIYTVCLFGHRELRDLRHIDERLTPIVKELIREKPFVSFLVGRNGEFDEYAASVIKSVRSELGKDNSELVLVLPYKVADIEYYEKYYDGVMIPESVSRAHPKSAITLRNRWMVEQADLVIANVERQSGGAYAAVRCAERLGKALINLCD